MALVPKIDPNKIFASNAPTQDKPAAFDNYEKGMDETRKNLGRPTIPQLNYLHQTADQKILWVHQNGGGLPYDASIEYAENAVTLKDGELKQLVDGAWVETKTKALPATAITTASSQNQQQINDFGWAKWYAKAGGYELGATVKLENGETVKSTEPANTANPNVDMTGWRFDDNTVESIADLLAIQNPKDGQTIETKSYYEGLGKGGSKYIFDLSKAGIDNGITIIKGWVLQLNDRICVTQAGCKLDGSSDDSVQFNACSALDLPMRMSISGRLRAESELLLNHSGFIGSGMFTQIDVVGGHDGVILPLGGGRLFQNIEKFFILSSDNSAQDHFAIRSKEITNPATQSVGNGFKIRDIEIGGGGRFGCGIALTDCFRPSINDVGMSSCANAVVLYGRVVQCKVGVVTSNSEEFEPVDVNSTVLNKLTALPVTIDKTKRYGLLVTGSTHTGTYQYPESIKSRDNAYVKHDYGLYHYDGLFCSYKDIDLDYNLIHGAYFYSCNGLVTLDTCWLAQNVGASHGIVIDTATFEAKRLVLKGIHGFAYGDLQVGSALIYQSSDGVTLPARRGVELDGVTLASNRWTRGISFNRMKDFTIKNFIAEGTAIDKGVSLLNCENFTYTDSISSVSYIDTPVGEFEVARITGEVNYNFLTLSTADRSSLSATVIQNKPLEMQGWAGAWKAPIKFGGGFLWIAANGDLMKKIGAVAPTSDADGVVVV